MDWRLSTGCALSAAWAVLASNAHCPAVLDCEHCGDMQKVKVYRLFSACHAFIASCASCSGASLPVWPVRCCCVQ